MDEQVDYDDLGEEQEEYKPEGTTTDGNTAGDAPSSGPADSFRNASRIAPSAVLFLSKFPLRTTEDDIRAVVSPFGELVSVTVRGPNAFIEFVTVEAATACKHALHKHSNLGSPSLICDFKKRDNVKN